MPDGLPTEIAALTEPMAVGVHAVAKGRPDARRRSARRRLRPGRPRRDRGAQAPGHRPDRRRRLLAASGARSPSSSARDVVVDPAKAEADDRRLAEGGRAARQAADLRVRRRARHDRRPDARRRRAARASSSPASAWSSTRIRPMLGINKELSLQFVLGYTPDEFAGSLRALADGKIPAEPLDHRPRRHRRRRRGLRHAPRPRGAREDPGDARDAGVSDGRARAPLLRRRHAGSATARCASSLAHDRDGRFRFAPIGGPTFRRRRARGRAPALPDAFVVQRADGALLVRSDATLHILARLGGGWRALAAVLRARPAPAARRRLRLGRAPAASAGSPRPTTPARSFRPTCARASRPSRRGILERIQEPVTAPTRRQQPRARARDLAVVAVAVTAERAIAPAVEPAPRGRGIDERRRCMPPRSHPHAPRACAH